jgi:hypothetical protein
MPSQRDLSRAAKLYRDFREEKPRRARTVNVEIPKFLTVLGNVTAIEYDTTRKRKTELYRHEFAQGSRPLICADARTGQLFIVEGRYHVTERGIVDLDARGKEIDDGT